MAIFSNDLALYGIFHFYLMSVLVIRRMPLMSSPFLSGARSLWYPPNTSSRFRQYSGQCLLSNEWTKEKSERKIEIKDTDPEQFRTFLEAISSMDQRKTLPNGKDLWPNINVGSLTKYYCGTFYHKMPIWDSWVKIHMWVNSSKMSIWDVFDQKMPMCANY